MTRSMLTFFQGNLPFPNHLISNIDSCTGMEITGIASQFAMQIRPICDASCHKIMRRNNCDALMGYSVLIF